MATEPVQKFKYTSTNYYFYYTFTNPGSKKIQRILKQIRHNFQMENFFDFAWSTFCFENAHSWTKKIESCCGTKILKLWNIENQCRINNRTQGEVTNDIQNMMHIFYIITLAPVNWSSELPEVRFTSGDLSWTSIKNT